MPRDIDEKKKRKALRKLRKAAEQAEANGAELSDWERQFIDEVEERVETYGSAFHDVEKGTLDEPLSVRQQMKLKEIDRKAKGKGGFKPRRSSFKSKTGSTYKSNHRDINEDIETDGDTVPETPEPSDKIARLVAKTGDSVRKASKAAVAKPTKSERRKPRFTVIDGGKSNDKEPS